MLKKIALTLALTAFASTACAETVRISGSGILKPILTELGNAYMKLNPKDVINVDKTSLGQAGGIAALNAGAIDIAMSSLPLTTEQLKLPLKSYEIAKIQGLIAVTKDVTVSNISSQQLCDIYSGKINNWKELGGADKPIRVFTRPEIEATKINFRESFVCMKNLKESPLVTSKGRSADMKAILESTDNGIGIFDAVSFHEAEGKVSQVKIDGQDYLNDKWPFILSTHLAVSIKPNSTVKKFLEFVKSPKGQKIIKEHKAKPVNFSL
jgi:phosphate transport system substrate-binding protein